MELGVAQSCAVLKVKHKIAMISGDDIRSEVVPAAAKVLDRAGKSSMNCRPAHHPPSGEC
jgi:isocitrate/isopropylmalate dehydrogenase